MSRKIRVDRNNEANSLRHTDLIYLVIRNAISNLRIWLQEANVQFVMLCSHKVKQVDGMAAILIVANYNIALLLIIVYFAQYRILAF